MYFDGCHLDLLIEFFFVIHVQLTCTNALNATLGLSFFLLRFVYFLISYSAKGNQIWQVYFHGNLHPGLT